jgi:hypothetical protein
MKLFVFLHQPAINRLQSLLSKELETRIRAFFPLSSTPSVSTGLSKSFNRFFHKSVLEEFRSCSEQGCQMKYFQTQNINLGKFWTFLL